jgi:hypothetical protein
MHTGFVVIAGEDVDCGEDFCLNEEDETGRV